MASSPRPYKIEVEWPATGERRKVSYETRKGLERGTESYHARGWTILRAWSVQRANPAAEEGE